MSDKMNIQKCFNENNINYEILREADDDAPALIQDCKDYTTVYEVMDKAIGLCYYINAIQVNALTEGILSQIVEFTLSLKKELKKLRFLQIMEAQYLEINHIKEYFMITTPKYCHDTLNIIHCQTNTQKMNIDDVNDRIQEEKTMFGVWEQSIIKQNYYLISLSSETILPVLNLFTNDWLRILEEDSLQFTEKFYKNKNELKESLKINSTQNLESLLDFKHFLVYIEKYYQKYFKEHNIILQSLSERSNIQKFNVNEMSNDYFILTVKKKDNGRLMFYKCEKINEQNKGIVQKYSKNIDVKDKIKKMYEESGYLIFEENLVYDLSENSAKWLLGSKYQTYQQFNLLAYILGLMVYLYNDDLYRYIDISRISLKYHSEAFNKKNIPNFYFRMTNQEEKNRDFIVSSFHKGIASNPYIQQKSYIKNTLLEELDKIKNTQFNQPTKLFTENKSCYQDLYIYIKKLSYIHYDYCPKNKFKINSKWKLCLDCKLIPIMGNLSIEYVDSLKFDLSIINERNLASIIPQIQANKNEISLSLLNIPNNYPIEQLFSKPFNLKHLKLSYQSNRNNQLFLKNQLFLYNLSSLRILTKTSINQIKDLENEVKIYLDQKESSQKLVNLTKQSIITTSIFIQEYQFDFSILHNFKPYEDNPNHPKKGQLSLFDQSNSNVIANIFNQPQQQTHGLFQTLQNNNQINSSTLVQQQSNHTDLKLNQFEKIQNNNKLLLLPPSISSITRTFENFNVQNNSTAPTQTTKKESNPFTLSGHNPFSQSNNPFNRTNNPFNSTHNPFSQGIDASQNSNKINPSSFIQFNDLQVPSPHYQFKQNIISITDTQSSSNNTNNTNSNNSNNKNSNIEYNSNSINSTFSPAITQNNCNLNKVDNLFDQPSKKYTITHLSCKNMEDKSSGHLFIPEQTNQQISTLSQNQQNQFIQEETQIQNNNEIQQENEFGKLFEYFQIYRVLYLSIKLTNLRIAQIQENLINSYDEILKKFENIIIAFNFPRETPYPNLLIDFIDKKKKYFGKLSITLKMQEDQLIIKKVDCRSQQKLCCHLQSLDQKDEQSINSQFIKEWYKAEQLTDLNFYMVGRDYKEQCKEGDYNQLQQQLYINQKNLNTLSIGVMICHHILLNNIPLFKFNPNQIKNLYNLTLHIKQELYHQNTDKESLKKLLRDLKRLKRLVILKIVVNQNNNNLLILKKLPRLVRLSQTVNS